MRHIAVCLLLKKSLDAAFRGEAFEGPEVATCWGIEFVTALRNGYPKYRHVNDIIRNIAGSLLDRIGYTCDCDELTTHMLNNPHAFLRTVLIIADHLGVKKLVHSALPQDLH